MELAPWNVLKIVDNVCGVKVDLQSLQFDTMSRNWKEASDGRGAGILATRMSEEKRLQLRQCHSERCDVAVVQLEDARAPAIVVAEYPYIQVDQVLKYFNRGDEGDIDGGIAGV